MIRSLSLLLLLFAGPATTATAQNATPPAERTVGYGITELESALFSAIANAGTQYSDARHEAAMSAQWLLLNWKAQHRDGLERRIGGLDEANRADYDALVETVRAAAQAVAEGPDARANTAAADGVSGATLLADAAETGNAAPSESGDVQVLDLSSDDQPNDG